MYSKVKRLRRNGERLPDRDIYSMESIVGCLTVCTVVNYQVLKLHAAGDTGAMAPLIPEMFRARLVTMHGARMLFQGYERIGNQADENSPVIKQEWSVEVVLAAPVAAA